MDGTTPPVAEAAPLVVTPRLATIVAANAANINLLRIVISL